MIETKEFLGQITEALFAPITTFSAGLGHLQKGHGVAFADFDRDWDQDLYNQLGGFYPDGGTRDIHRAVGSA
ncbi:MAG: hypothetical protein O3C21_07685, partial [Verrucomicrobia bacterium]|nr:hypothetical protein [Verrucomicrobiota bacterium]